MIKLLPLSVFIIAKDEEDRIVHTLKSVVGFVDEVIVVDSGSSDNTVKVCEDLGAKVVFNEWQGYGPQKCFAESLCSHKWLLNLDADEALSDELQSELLQLFSSVDSINEAGFHIPIKIMGRFQQKPGLFAPSNDPVRLYHRDYAGFKDSTVHDSVILKDSHSSKRFGKLKGCYYHRCFRSYKHAIAKINRYSSMQALDLNARNVNTSTVRLVFEPLIAFIKAYFLRRYMFLGVEGVVESYIYALARLLRLAKYRELQKLESVDKSAD